MHVTKQHAFGDKSGLRIGYGLRYTGAFGSKVDFATAPAKYTVGKTGPVAFFSEPIPGNIDTLTFNKVQTNAFNVFFSIEHNLYKKLAFNFNLDLVGFTLGAHQKATPLLSTTTTSAKTTSLNALLIGDNDLGSLNSEFLLKYYATKKLTLQAGFGFLFTEYTTEKKYTLGNDRFRNKAGMLTLGVVYAPNRSF